MLHCVPCDVSEVTRSLAFPFRDRQWLQRALVGSLLELFPALVFLALLAPVLVHHRPRSWVLVPLGLLPIAALFALACRFIVLGYLARIARGVLDGTGDGLPAWDRTVEDLLSGLKLAVVALALALPPLGAIIAAALLVIAVTHAELAVIPVAILAPPLVLATLFYLPAGLLAAIARDDVGAAFDAPRVFRAIGRILGPYIIAFLVTIAAEVVAQFGLLLCCVGVFVTRFLAHCVAVHAFATAFREGMDLVPGAPASEARVPPQTTLPPL